ncbi:VOC family protein [Nocardia sienata]|uniref:VOC family protein n=1 Tax=Nocardia sienata TaxID=248552 RepID=UPI000AE854C0|nr:VOC family protein [Nocardia sienata]
MVAHRVVRLSRQVPDLEAARRFYRQFGLEETAPGVFASVLGGDQLFLREGPRPAIDAIVLGVDSEDDIHGIRARLESRGVTVDVEGAAISAVEPITNLRFEFLVANRLEPDPVIAPRTTADRADLVPREAVRPLRLGHVVLGCTDVEAAKGFFLDGIGMRLSDYVTGGPFMRFETDHHNLVLVPAPMTLLHHTAWKVRGIDEIGYGGSQMIENHPERHAWGLGRHAASANYFWYLKDPAGAFAEYYYSEMDELADSPSFWDPVPESEGLPVAVWASPPLTERPLVPEAMPAPILTADGR